MPNNLGITEVTLAEVANSTVLPNLMGALELRKDWYQPVVVRITDHEDDEVAETDDPYKMALFCSQAHGQPWNKHVNCQKHLIHKPTDGLAPAVDMNIIFPDFDYTTFE